jgi:site-specific recombinase XerD
MSDAVKEALDEFRKIENHDVYVFGNLTHRRAIYMRFKKDIQKAGLNGHPHKLRHTFISQHILAGTPLSVVQKMAGHSSITTTEKYIHAPDENIANLNVRIGGENTKLVKPWLAVDNS